MIMHTLMMIITIIMTIHTAMITPIITIIHIAMITDIIIMITRIAMIMITIMIILTLTRTTTEMPLLAGLNRLLHDKRPSIILEERFFLFSAAKITT